MRCGKYAGSGTPSKWIGPAVKTRVKITGEFWLQTHEGDGNYNIKRWLEQEDSEVMPPPVAVWLHYLLHPAMRKLERRIHRASIRNAMT